MARTRSALPWGALSLFALLFLISWWVEDCVLYAIPWQQLRPVQSLARFADKLQLNLLLVALGYALSAVGHFLWTGFAGLCQIVQRNFDALPDKVRNTAGMRALAWVGASVAQTFGGNSFLVFGNTLILAAEKLVKFVIALNGAAWIYNIGRRFGRMVGTAVMWPIRFYSEREPEVAALSAVAADSKPQPPIRPSANNHNRRRREYTQFLQGHVERIGIILPGGGARAAYQAGALKAIYEFLRDYNALHKVKMIAATSTGAWNAMFWLAGMMEQKDRRHPDIAKWWRTVTFDRLMECPWLYVPFMSGSLLRNTPWRENFNDLFKNRIGSILDRNAPIHFYFTRSDVERGLLNYSTNWAGIGDRIRQLGKDRDDAYRYFDIVEAGADGLKRISQSIFSSLDVAPLFPYAKIGDDLYEDGSVIDSVPIRFASPIESCDMLFVLPLTPLQAGFNRHSLVSRMTRVMNIRRALMERQTLKLTDTVNQFYQRIERLQFGVETLAPHLNQEGVAAEALSGVREEISEFNDDYRLLYVFTLCPYGKMDLGTYDFWRGRLIGEAFDMMYMQTRRELQMRFFEDIEPEDPRVVLVDGQLPKNDEAPLPRPEYRKPSEL